MEVFAGFLGEKNRDCVHAAAPEARASLTSVSELTAAKHKQAVGWERKQQQQQSVDSQLAVVLYRGSVRGEPEGWNSSHLGSSRRDQQNKVSSGLLLPDSRGLTSNLCTQSCSVCVCVCGVAWGGGSSHVNVHRGPCTCPQNVF